MKPQGTQSAGKSKESGLPNVRVDRNGGLHVSGKDMAASSAFQQRLERAAKMKFGPPPAAPSREKTD